MGLRVVGTEGTSTLRAKPVTFADHLVSNEVDAEGRIQLPVSASNINAMLTTIDTKLLSTKYVESMGHMAIIATLPNGDTVKIDLDLFIKNGLLYHILRDQNMKIVMTKVDDYGRSYINTEATAEANDSSYASTIGTILTEMLEVAREEISNGKYYLQLARPNAKLGKRKLSKIYPKK